MEGSRVRALALILVVIMGMVAVGQSSFTTPTSFRDCYAKCFLFCMIEPNQTLCSCTTQCLKDCIFPTDSPNAAAMGSSSSTHAAAETLGFCKLGCASSLCSNISTKVNPNGQSMENCVGSCSKKCTISYSSSSP